MVHNANVASDWMEGRQKMMTLLQEEAELENRKNGRYGCSFTG